MNIRSPNDTHGYPSRDDTPADILARPCATEKEYRSQCYAFFAPIFKVLRTSLEKNGAHWYENMCEPPSAVRHLFFEDLGRECDNVDKEILASSTGRTIMKKYYKELVKSSCFPHAKDNEPRVVLHDEQPFSRADVLLRTIKEYSEDNNHAVWVVFASTTSKVTHFASPQALFSSARVAVKGQLLFPPFTQLGWDQNAPALGEIQHYSVWPWVSLKEGDDALEGLLHLAEQKLCGPVEFDPHNHHQTFAVLAQRFGLDIAFGHRNAVGYVETSVASHLRACIKTTEDRIWSYTIYPSEPILSCAAASLLHGGNPPPAKTDLVSSLEILERMVNDGVIDIGQIGELVSRFLWLLAKDFFVREKVVQKDVGWGFDQQLEDCQLVSVVAFLRFVFGPRIWNGKPEAQELFQNAYINFSHWVSMDSDIRRHERLGEVPYVTCSISSSI
ncbi:hypothetical protein OG21DRAFT_1486202 [Imleria badia]|nr:hypothetical protein OG21DRAFT_1486202 [Imleria badia]